MAKRTFDFTSFSDFTTRVAPLLLILGATACSSISLTPYQPNIDTTDALSRAQVGYNAGSVSGLTRVESDQLVKSSMPCRTRVIKTPDGEPVTVYIENALETELKTAGKIDADPSRRIDVTVVKLESDTSKIHNGIWSIDLIYKIGPVAREIQTATNYAFAADTDTACQNTADAFNPALRENFKKFFATLK